MRQRPAWREPDPVPAWVTRVEAMGHVMFTIALIAFVALAISGCATAEPIVHTEVVRVDKVVPVPCKVKPVDVPTWALDMVNPDADSHTLAKHALAEVEQRIEYETQLKAAITACQ